MEVTSVSVVTEFVLSLTEDEQRLASTIWAKGYDGMDLSED